MALHGKAGRLRALRPDLAVVPECACPEVLLRREPDLGASDFAWSGASPRKGLAVFAFGPFRLEPDRAIDPRSATALPVHVSGPAAFRLVAVWALPRWAHRPWEPPPEPLPRALDRLLPFLREPPAVLAGDFSSALVSRRAGGRLLPSPLARRLRDLGFESAYHRSRGVEHGAEREPTFFLYRSLSRGAHADHVFLDRGTAAGLRSVTIGWGPRWVRSSDHAPVVVDVSGPLDGSVS